MPQERPEAGASTGACGMHVFMYVVCTVCMYLYMYVPGANDMSVAFIQVGPLLFLCVGSEEAN
jgi:hypothetical protein